MQKISFCRINFLINRRFLCNYGQQNPMSSFCNNHIRAFGTGMQRHTFLQKRIFHFTTSSLAADESNKSSRDQTKTASQTGSADVEIEKPPTKMGIEKESNKKVQAKTGNLKRKRKMRNLATLKDGEKQQVTGVAIARNFDLEALQEKEFFTRQYEMDVMRYRIDNETFDADEMAVHCKIVNKHRQPIGEEEQPPQIEEFYLFSEGVVVFWNIDKSTRKQIIDHLEKQNKEQLFTQQEDDEETMHIEFTENNSNAGDDTIYLNSQVHLPDQQSFPYYKDELNARLERFAFSHAMAASARMRIWEQKIDDDLNDQLEQCIDTMKNSGEFKWNMKKACKMIGNIAHIRHSANLTDLMDDDIYWDFPNYNRIYDSMSRRLTLHQRLEALNKKIDYCESFTKTGHEMLHQKYSHRLEWIIIILIAAEVLINYEKVFQLFGDLWMWLGGGKKPRKDDLPAGTQPGENEAVAR